MQNHTLEDRKKGHKKGWVPLKRRQKNSIATSRRQADKDPFQKLVGFPEDGWHLRGCLLIGTMLLGQGNGEPVCWGAGADSSSPRWTDDLNCHSFPVAAADCATAAWGHPVIRTPSQPPPTLRAVCVGGDSQPCIPPKGHFVVGQGRRCRGGTWLSACLFCTLPSHASGAAALTEALRGTYL